MPPRPEACRLDRRCAGAADSDGSCTTGQADADADADCAARANALLAASRRHPGAAVHVYSLRGSRHASFIDAATMFVAPPLRRTLPFGSIDAARGLRVTADYLAAFFDQVLAGRARPLLDHPSGSYPEVSYLPAGGG